MKSKMICTTLAIACVTASCMTAEARGRHKKYYRSHVTHSSQVFPTMDDRYPQAFNQPGNEAPAYSPRRTARHNALTEVRNSRYGQRISSAGRPSRWCGWWLGRELGMLHRELWLARNWANVGSNAGQPGVGVVVVWRNHVGIITGRAGNQWIVKSGNDGNAVRERPRSIAGAIAFRRV